MNSEHIIIVTMQGVHNINVIYQYNKPFNFITINLMKR